MLQSEPQEIQISPLYEKKRLFKQRIHRILTYGMLGVFGYDFFVQIGFMDLLTNHQYRYYYFFAGLLCAGLSLTPLRIAVKSGMGLLLLLTLVLLYTPLPFWMMQISRSDPLQKSDAVVTLSDMLYPDGSMSSMTYDRVMASVKLVRQGLAPLMLVTRLPPPYKDTKTVVERELQSLRLPVKVVEVGPVSSTHDEALKVAELARQRHWKRVIVVTSPMHTRRAKAVFEKTGLQVIIQPCQIHEYDLHRLSRAQDRFKICRHWLRETLGYWIYRRRGWIN